MGHVATARVDFASTAARLRNTTRPLVLIGFKRQGNLGLGYLASALRARGYRVEILDFEDPHATILDQVAQLDPILVGFSLIFQFYVLRYEALARALRDCGITAHFTMGGHFPTLSFAHTLELVPQLDSVVRFEGELTLLEMADALGLGQDWRGIQGLAYRQGGEVVTTAMRPLIADLDELPYPDRSVEPPMTLGLRTLQMLASRGCIRTCSFCSIHMFYRSAPGKVVRTRRPAEVAAEMRQLHERRGASIILFQDDDFPVYGQVWRRWTRDFIAELYRQNLPGRMLWKINARADAIDPELFAEMRDAGLYQVYMGLESGSADGLTTLNKSITVEQNLTAVDTLKRLGIVFDFGFMMLDPSSSFASILENVTFLRRIVGDGSMAAEFCRMIPYDGTPIKDTLAAEGRLRGDVCNPDYAFLDPRLHDFYIQVNELLNMTGWIHGLRALSPQLKFAWNELAVIERFAANVGDLARYRATLQRITRASNTVLFDVVDDLAYSFLDASRPQRSAGSLRDQCSLFVAELLRERNAFVQQNQNELRQALEAVG
jgi:anaerobic magnesium-protoporphyrin IX monomethyl ester cyclase